MLFGYTYATGLSLVTRYQKVYGRGFVLGDGVIAGDGVITGDARLRSDGRFFGGAGNASAGVIAGDGTPFCAASDLFGDGGARTGSGQVFGDGRITGDGVIPGDGVITGDALLRGDDTEAMDAPRDGGNNFR